MWLFLRILGFFNDKFETSQNVEHSCAVAFVLVTKSVETTRFAESGVFWKRVPAFLLGSKMALAMIAPIWIYQKRLSSCIFFENFESASRVCYARTSAQRHWRIPNCKCKGCLIFWVWRFHSRSLDLVLLELQRLELESNLLAQECTASQHFPAVKWCVEQSSCLYQIPPIRLDWCLSLTSLRYSASTASPITIKPETFRFYIYTSNRKKMGFR